MVGASRKGVEFHASVPFCSTNPFFSAFFYLPSIDFAFIFYFSFCSAVRGFAHYFRVFYENQIPIIHVMRKQNGTKFVLRTPQRGCHVRETHLNCHRCFGFFSHFPSCFRVNCMCIVLWQNVTPNAKQSAQSVRSVFKVNNENLPSRSLCARSIRTPFIF